MMAKHTKEQKTYPNWVKHVFTSLASIGLGSGIVWLSTGMPIASLIAQAFPMGVYTGAVLIMAAASAFALSPFAVAALYFGFVGALVGVGVVGLSVLAYKFSKHANAMEASNDSELDDSSEYSSETDDELSEIKPETNSFYNKYLGLGINFVTSSLAAAGVSLFFPGAFVAVGVIPTFFAGMFVGIVAVPFFGAIELLGALSLPFALGGLGVGAVLSGATAFLCLKDNNEDPAPAPDTGLKMRPKSENDLDDPKQARSLNRLNKDKKQATEHSVHSDLTENGTSKPFFGTPKAKESRSTDNTDIADNSSCCGLGWTS